MSHTPAPASPEAGHEPSPRTPDGHLTVGDIVALVEAAAPPGLAASWDSNGLICGDPAEPVRSILLAVDPVAAVVDEAIDAGVDMVITHHPLYLRGTEHVAATDPKGRTVHRLIRAGIALLNAHTSLDAAHGGVADALADLYRQEGQTRTAQHLLDNTVQTFRRLHAGVPDLEAFAYRRAVAQATSGQIATTMAAEQAPTAAPGPRPPGAPPAAPGWPRHRR